MPLGILTEEEFELEIAKANRNGNSNLHDKNARIESLPHPGRNNKSETPESARKLISELAISGASIEEISHEFNISPSSISAYKHGSTSTTTYHEPNKELANHNTRIRQGIIKKARKKLVLAIDNIDEEKLSDSSGKELSSIAKDMSSVIRNLEPQVETNVNNNAIVFFAPQMRKEEDYPIIQVNE